MRHEPRGRPRCTEATLGTASTSTAMVTGLAAKTDRRPTWGDLRSQHLGLQVLVWLFALPVPVWLWAAQLPAHRRAPAKTFAGMMTVFCLAVPIAGGVGERRATGSTAEVAELTTRTTQTSAPASTTTAAPTTAAPTTAAPTTAAPTTAAPTTAAPTTPAPTTAPPTTATPTSAAAAPASDVAGLIGQLSVAPETDQGSYDRGQFSPWIDADGNGCDTHCEVLAAERHDSRGSRTADGSPRLTATAPRTPPNSTSTTWYRSLRHGAAALRVGILPVERRLPTIWTHPSRSSQ